MGPGVRRDDSWGYLYGVGNPIHFARFLSRDGYAGQARVWGPNMWSAFARPVGSQWRSCCLKIEFGSPVPASGARWRPKTQRCLKIESEPSSPATVSPSARHGCGAWRPWVERVRRPILATYRVGICRYGAIASRFP